MPAPVSKSSFTNTLMWIQATFQRFLPPQSPRCGSSRGIPLAGTWRTGWEWLSGRGRRLCRHHQTHERSHGPCSVHQPASTPTRLGCWENSTVNSLWVFSSVENSTVNSLWVFSSVKNSTVNSLWVFSSVENSTVNSLWVFSSVENSTVNSLWVFSSVENSTVNSLWVFSSAENSTVNSLWVFSSAENSTANSLWVFSSAKYKAQLGQFMV